MSIIVFLVRLLFSVDQYYGRAHPDMVYENMVGLFSKGIEHATSFMIYVILKVLKTMVDFIAIRVGQPIRKGWAPSKTSALKVNKWVFP
jgi:hypothetical protein